MKKLQTWQKVLLIIFYPVGIVYFIIWFCNRSKPAAQREIVRELYSNVVATVYPNDDGSSRQRYIAMLKPGEEIFFHKAPTEEYPDSIGVFTKKKQQIGAVSFHTINELFGLYTHNDFSVYVNEILHTERGLGVNMLIRIYK